jgi:hypothetical protein
MEPMLRAVKEAVTEARAAGATEAQIETIIMAAEHVALERAHGVDLDWLVAQIRAAAEPGQTVH